VAQQQFGDRLDFGRRALCRRTRGDQLGQFGNAAVDDFARAVTGIDQQSQQAQFFQFR